MDKRTWLRRRVIDPRVRVWRQYQADTAARRARRARRAALKANVAPKQVYLVFLNPGAATVWSFNDLESARRAAKVVDGGGVIVALPILEDYRGP
jgi:hypothetical protein